MFGSQSMQAYIAFGWFANFFRHHTSGADRGRPAGGLLRGAVHPDLDGHPDPGRCASTCAGDRARRSATRSATSGMLLAPVGGAWVWMFLGGIGSGIFPLTLTLIGLRSRHIPVTAALSAFTQGFGYIIAGAGPLLVGVLLGPSNDWTWPLVALLVATAAAGVAGWDACRAEYVDDQLSPAPPVAGLAGTVTATLAAREERTRDVLSTDASATSWTGPRPSTPTASRVVDEPRPAGRAAAGR